MDCGRVTVSAVTAFSPTSGRRLVVGDEELALDGKGAGGVLSEG